MNSDYNTFRCVPKIHHTQITALSTDWKKCTDDERDFLNSFLTYKIPNHHEILTKSAKQSTDFITLQKKVEIYSSGLFQLIKFNKIGESLFVSGTAKDIKLFTNHLFESNKIENQVNQI